MGQFYDEVKIKAMEAAAAPPQARAGKLGFYAMIVLAIIAGACLLWWKITHNPGTMVVDINKASAAQLSYLPGVGPVTAKKIIENRPYQTPEDLKKVPGIGDKTFEKMKARVKVE